MGVVLNYAVAIGASIWLQSSSRTSRFANFTRDAGTGSYYLYPYAGVDATFINWQGHLSSDEIADRVANTQARHVDRLPYFLPLEARRTLGDSDKPFRSRATMYTSAGWPTRALWARLDVPYQRLIDHRRVVFPGDLCGGVPWMRRGQYLPMPDHVIPLRPVALPTAMNIATWGAMFWMLRFAPFHFRSQIRRRRECCVACGYDLARSPNVCPECGRALAATRVTT